MCVSCIVLQVQSSLADTLLHCGVATSRYAGRLFRPPKNAAPTTSYSASTSGSLSAIADKAPGDALTQPPAGTLEVVTAAPASSSLSGGTSNSSSITGLMAGGAGNLSSPQPPAAAAAAAHSSSAATQGLRSAAADDASAEAEAEAALAAADVIMEQLAAVNAADVASSGYVAADGDFEFKSSQGLGRQGLSAEPLPLVMQETHTEQE